MRLQAARVRAFDWPKINLAISRRRNLRSAALSTERLRPRFAETRLVEALADTPVVFIHGPRQCGKTTLARIAGDPRGYAYFSFDDPAALAAAKADPNGFVAELPARTILDEIQRVPE